MLEVLSRDLAIPLMLLRLTEQLVWEVNSASDLVHRSCCG
jgi:hypothetical protein